MGDNDLCLRVRDGQERPAGGWLCRYILLALPSNMENIQRSMALAHIEEENLILSG